ncbi:C-GCAxxG-C-C family (seleno)protein [Shewanella marina]|uniref:C-GCAxxG-C-C family (seleno)protein n=1 Tax=Shewanella marina TaxID=487319 RepID=UPI00046EE93C|nr:C-GCAxxG-C-C family (seleno)protein [Shewanella marina]
MDRRKALTQIIGLSTAAGATLVAAPLLAATDNQGNYKLGIGEKLKYVPLDPAATAKLAYNTGSGCMHQVFYAIVTMLAQSNSPDAAKFDSIPTALSAYGFAGVMGQGTLCGNLNAAAMVVNFLDDIGKQNSAVVQAIYRYYETQELPRSDAAFIAAIGSTDEKTLEVGKSSVANSVLCHPSISNWSKASGKPFSAKKERCYRLSGDITYRLVELLNDAHAGKIIGDHHVITPTEQAQECKSCHGVSDTVASAASVKTDMECTVCHTGHMY